MSDAECLIPDVTDDDIEWVCTLMGIESLDTPRREFLKCRTTVDLSACPGSGKTTLIVAKLAILARKWPHRTKGICILSHTNVAREQIEHRLGRTVVGQRLLSYPHFVDTIHGFVNRFLALPWLNSNGYPSPTIDDDVTIAYRRGVLGSDYYTVQSFLSNKYSGFDRLRICGRDLSFDLSGKPFPAQPSAPSYQHAKRAVEIAAKAGFFCYDEMFVWADALLEEHNEFVDWLAHRFPFVMVDEMQDTFERQAAFLNRVFPRTSKKLVVQRVGDPNQAIFDSLDVETPETDQFPDAGRSFDIPNSYRFDNDIAALVSPFAVHTVGTGGLSGIRPNGTATCAKAGGHAVFVFPDNSTEGVLDAYGRHALSVLGPELACKGPITAVGHIHQDDSNVSPGHDHYPKSVGHYWNGYAAHVSRKDPNPHTLVQYLRVAQGLTADGNVLFSGVEKIASGILRFARRIGDIGELKRKARTHRAIVEKLENAPEARTAYRGLLRLLLADRTALSAEDWPALSESLTMIAIALCDGEIDKSKAECFLAWPQDDPSLQPPAGSPTRLSTPNVYSVQGHEASINIRLGSIHSVKGQTHVATLLLNTFWHHHSGLRIMPWLKGEKANGNGAQSRDTQRLLHTYVAMTRPSHLLCVAVPRSALGSDQTAQTTTVTALRQRGWCVAEITDGSVQWHE